MGSVTDEEIRKGLETVSPDEAVGLLEEAIREIKEAKGYLRNSQSGGLSYIHGRLDAYLNRLALRGS